jgi:hypothetical protein
MFGFSGWQLSVAALLLVQNVLAVELVPIPGPSPSDDAYAKFEVVERANSGTSEFDLKDVESFYWSGPCKFFHFTALALLIYPKPDLVETTLPTSRSSTPGPTNMFSP